MTFFILWLLLNIGDVWLYARLSKQGIYRRNFLMSGYWYTYKAWRSK